MAKTGRKPRFESAKEMEDRIDAYFEQCKGEPLYDEYGMPVFDKKGNPVLIHEKPPTIVGLALALGFTSRQTLLNYAAKPEFVDTITRGKSRVEAYAAERLFDRDGAKGAEFTLACNFGWKMPKETAEDGEKSQSGVILMPEVQDESHT